MHGFLWGVVLGVPAGVFATYFGANRAIAEYHKAAAEAGVFFQRVEGKLVAIKKAL